MSTQSFLKGLLMALVGVVVAVLGTYPIDWILVAISGISVALVYVGKNLIAVLHSDSPAGSLSFINIVSGLLVALGTGILDAVGSYLISGVILWPVVLKVVLGATFTYLSTTWFAPPYTTKKTSLFV